MAKDKLNPLTWNVPITNPKDGTPTIEFQRKWGQQQAQNEAIPVLDNAAAVSALLDFIGAVEGEALYRGVTAWEAALPGGDLAGTYPNPTVAKIQGEDISTTPPTDGQVLTWDNTTSEWTPETPSAGGNVIIGSGVPTAAEPAGTLYSRDDTDALYSSQPTSASANVVQAEAQATAQTGLASFNFTTGPTAGNLLILVYSDIEGPPTPPTGVNGWTLGPNVVQSPLDSGNGLFTAAYYKYADGTEGTGQLTFQSTYGVTSSGVIFGYEIGGVSGTWAADFDQAVTGSTYPATSSTVTSDLTTAFANELVLFFAYDRILFGNFPTMAAPFAVADTTSNYFFGMGASSHVAEVTSGTAVGTTISWNGTSDEAANYIMIGIKGTGLTANWDLIAPAPAAITQASVMALANFRF